MLTLGVEALRVRHARGRRGLRDDTREVEYRAPPLARLVAIQVRVVWTPKLAMLEVDLDEAGPASRHSGSGRGVPGGGFQRAACLRE